MTAPAATSQRDVFEALKTFGVEGTTTRTLADHLELKSQIPVGSCIYNLLRKGFIQKKGKSPSGESLYACAPDADVSQIRAYHKRGEGSKAISATPQGRFKIAMENFINHQTQASPIIDSLMESYTEIDKLIMTPEDREALSHLDAMTQIMRQQKR